MLGRDSDPVYLSSEIEQSITNEIKNFVYQIIADSKSKIKDDETLYDYNRASIIKSEI